MEKSQVLAEKFKSRGNGGADILAQRMPSQDGDGGEKIKRENRKQRAVLHQQVSIGRGALFVIYQRKDGGSKSCLSSTVHKRELAH